MGEPWGGVKTPCDPVLALLMAVPLRMPLNLGAAFVPSIKWEKIIPAYFNQRVFLNIQLGHSSERAFT